MVGEPRLRFHLPVFRFSMGTPSPWSLCIAFALFLIASSATFSCTDASSKLEHAFAFSSSFDGQENSEKQTKCNLWGLSFFVSNVFPQLISRRQGLHVVLCPAGQALHIFLGLHTFNTNHIYIYMVVKPTHAHNSTPLQGCSIWAWACGKLSTITMYR